MKLRNKKTGEIVDLSEGFIRDTYNGEMIQIKPIAISNKEGYVYGSLAELNAEWEDYEEPKEYYFINELGTVGKAPTYCFADEKECRKSIGNYFESKEEAEKAVKKLKAYKRLKDKGFRFSDFVYTELKDYARVNISATMINDSINEDLNLLFGGDE